VGFNGSRVERSDKEGGSFVFFSAATHRGDAVDEVLASISPKLALDAEAKRAFETYAANTPRVQKGKNSYFCIKRNLGNSTTIALFVVGKMNNRH